MQMMKQVEENLIKKDLTSDTSMSHNVLCTKAYIEWDGLRTKILLSVRSTAPLSVRGRTMNAFIGFWIGTKFGDFFK